MLFTVHYMQILIDLINPTLLDISVIFTVIYCISPSIILQIPFTANNCNTLCIMGIVCDVRPHIQRFTVFFKIAVHYCMCCNDSYCICSLALFYWGCIIFLLYYIWIDTICSTPCSQGCNSLGLTILDVLHLGVCHIIPSTIIPV